MSVRITGSDDSVALYDSTTGVAFGPIFENDTKADEFLEWHRMGHEANRKWDYKYGQSRNFTNDVRLYRDDELVELHKLWLFETEGE
jgi:hypothetical protein